MWGKLQRTGSEPEVLQVKRPSQPHGAGDLLGPAAPALRCTGARKRGWRRPEAGGERDARLVPAGAVPQLR